MKLRVKLDLSESDEDAYQDGEAEESAAMSIMVGDDEISIS